MDGADHRQVIHLRIEWVRSLNFVFGSREAWRPMW